MDFLTTEERTQIKADLDTAFDTMSSGHTILVVKEPIKTAITDPNDTNNVFGFGPEQTEPIYTYTPESRTFPAVVRWGNQAQWSPLSAEINASIDAGTITIKVKRDCYDYINEGGVQNIVIDDRTFLLDGMGRRQLFLDDQTYYLFTLRATK